MSNKPQENVKTRRPTLRDVALEAGVSPKTVSRVINEDRLVSSATVARVSEVIATLGYQPNEVARSLRKQRSHTIGLVIADISNPFYAGCAKAVEEVAREHGYAVVLCASGENLDTEREYIGLLSRRRVDGLLIVPAGTAGKEDGRSREERYADEMPIVALDRPIEDVPADAVVVQNRGGVREAVGHLIWHGHQRIGFVGGYGRVYTVRERLRGYQEAMREAGLQDLHRFGAIDVCSSSAVARELLELSPPPTALFTWNNLATVGVLEALEGRGMRVPEDVALIGFDEIDLGTLLHPRLTLIRQPAEELGRIAAEFLFERLESHDQPSPRCTVLPTELMVRESCGCEGRARLGLRQT